jgi:pimeloyl-ACP methyl ester carboxylesterase
VLTLADGGDLEFEVSGPAGGPVCLFHHGTPGSGVQLPPVQSAAAALGLRLVTYSRAGYAGSSRHRTRSVASIAVDVEQILDALRVDQCVVLGWSGGGPHALATAAALPHRVRAVSSLAGVKPFTSLADFTAGMGEDNIEEFGLAIAGEDALRAPLEAAAAEMVGASVEGIIDGMLTLLPPADVAALKGPAGAGLVAMMVAGLATADGWIDDDLAIVRRWGFTLSDLAVPVHVWQGSEDLMVPVAHGRALAQALPIAAYHEVEGAGHISLVVDHIAEILDEVVDYF